MKVLRHGLPLVFSAALLATAGCSSTPTAEEGLVGDDPMMGGEETFAMDAGEVLSMYGGGRLLSEEEKLTVEKAAMAERRVVYFEFDSATILPEDRELLRLHALYLSTHPQVQVALAGHTDERGTREYNMALGERRAKAVEGFLMVNGADREQTETLSYGEELPALPGASEASYAKNRRVELDYR